MDKPLKSSEYDLVQLGLCLKKRRLAIKPRLSQHKLALKMKVHETDISHWETGRRPISDRNFAVFCLNVGCRIADIDQDYMEGRGKI